MNIQDLKNKKLAVWGLGREGRAVLKLLLRYFPNQAVAVLNDKPVTDQARESIPADLQVEIITGEKIKSVLPDFDIVIKSPGVSIYRPEIAAARKSGVVFTSGTNLWFNKHCHEKIVCITGTKGKSTTAALTGYLLKSLGRNVVVAGNIGTPLLETFDASPAPDVWVLELSSFQITDLQSSPDIAVLVSLFSSHLDWHGSLDKYHQDKLKLFSNLKENSISILNRADSNIMKQNLAWQNPVYFNDDSSIHISDSSIFDGSQRLFPASEFPLLGAHNLSNLCAALTVVRALDLDPGLCGQHLPSFRGLPHRLEILGERDGLRFINDSISTIPEAVIAAIKSLPAQPITLLVGGQEKGLDWSSLAVFLTASSLHAVITLPDNGSRIAAAFREAASKQSGKHPELHESSSLSDAVARSKQITPSGGTVLLSPACPSYGQFKNFEERGRIFAQLAGFG
jgi:UDP-N-acetylmuramoyl-L-alanine---L-glutamate ligase